MRRVRVVYCHDAEELNSKLEKSKLDGKKGIRPLVRLKRQIHFRILLPSQANFVLGTLDVR